MKQKQSTKSTIRDFGDADVVAPPASFQVESVHRLVLFAADGTPLTRRVWF